MKRALFGIVASLFMVTGAQAAGVVAGQNYLVLPSEQPTSAGPGQIEVIEFFWYGCNHCFAVEPHAKQWLENKPSNVKFVRIPAVLNRGWDVSARAYYTAEALGVVDQVHDEIFKAIHVDRRMRVAVNKDLLAELFAEHAGVSAEDFDNAWNSFPVASKLKRAELMGRRYRITGVPAMIINGKYATDATKAGGYGAIFDVIDHLVRKEMADSK
ncbi:MAG: thiol:disulfide interchange protein DsbA/DsbL [Gammaproteobacteria bacterium]|nr:thiol:disulfide interchange protein DsbA/DsbL [Gammaproteobacteria bacterium]